MGLASIVLEYAPASSIAPYVGVPPVSWTDYADQDQGTPTILRDQTTHAQIGKVAGAIESLRRVWRGGSRSCQHGLHTEVVGRMLPTFPKIEDFRRRANQKFVNQSAESRTGILPQINKHVQHEGRHIGIMRHDDTQSETPILTATAEVTIARMPLASFTEEVLLQQLEKAAEQLARSMSEQMFAQIDRTLAEVGNVLDAKGQPLSEELILKMLARIEHQFEPDGTWKPPTLVVSPQVYERLMKDGVARSGGSPAFNEALGKILEKKKDEHRRREADRVLAG